jgi:hypothetical protein
MPAIAHHNSHETWDALEFRWRVIPCKPINYGWQSRKESEMKRSSIIALSSLVSVLAAASFAAFAMTENAHAPSQSSVIHNVPPYLWSKDWGKNACGELLQQQIRAQNDKLRYYLDGKTAMLAVFASEKIRPGYFPGTIYMDHSTLQAVTLVKKGSGPASTIKNGDRICVFTIK